MSSALERRIARLEAQRATRTTEGDTPTGWPVFVSGAYDQPDLFGYEGRLWPEGELMQHLKSEYSRKVFLIAVMRQSHSLDALESAGSEEA